MGPTLSSASDRDETYPSLTFFNNEPAICQLRVLRLHNPVLQNLNGSLVKLHVAEIITVVLIPHYNS